MTKELSALFDNELEVHEEPALWVALKTEPHLRERWRNYKLIGDALRDEQNLACDITGDVMQALVDEPVIFTPQKKRAITWSSVIMAMAASVAGVAVVGWLALGPQFKDNELQVLAKAPSQTMTVAAPQADSAGIQEYVLAHQANAPGLYLQGGTQHIRTVSVVSDGK